MKLTLNHTRNLQPRLFEEKPVFKKIRFSKRDCITGGWVSQEKSKDIHPGGAEA